MHGHERHLHPGHRLPDHHRHEPGQRERYRGHRLQRDVHAGRRQWHGHVHHCQHAARGLDALDGGCSLGHADAVWQLPDYRSGHRQQRLHGHKRDLQPGPRLPDHHRDQSGHHDGNGRHAVQSNLHPDGRHRDDHVLDRQHAAVGPHALQRGPVLRASRARSRSSLRPPTATAARARALPTRSSSPVR
jgi:hypothetical protein